MGINCYFMINKTNTTYKIYDIDHGNQLVGRLYPRESYIYYGEEGERSGIVFRNSSGQLVGAAINNYTHPLPGMDDDDFFNNYSCLHYPYGTATINGVTYKTFKMRATKAVYKADGTVWGSVAANCLVATNSMKVGEEHCDWKLINYVQSTSGQWVKVQGAGYNHGFVDTGLATNGSGYNSIKFYGSW